MVKRGARAFISEFSSEGAVLEGGEERVQLGQRGAVRGLQFLHGGDAAGEVALEGEGRKNHLQLFQ
jgi:hypothetical protein